MRPWPILQLTLLMHAVELAHSADKLESVTAANSYRTMYRSGKYLQKGRALGYHTGGDWAYEMSNF